MVLISFEEGRGYCTMIGARLRNLNGTGSSGKVPAAAAEREMWFVGSIWSRIGLMERRYGAIVLALWVGTVMDALL